MGNLPAKYGENKWRGVPQAALLKKKYMKN